MMVMMGMMAQGTYRDENQGKGSSALVTKNELNRNNDYDDALLLA
jgi:hypothetical protein